MRNEAKGYFLKEYGSWSVLIIATVIGVGVSHAFTWAVVPLFLALALLINSKQAFMKWIRNLPDRVSFVAFLAQIGIAVALLIALFGSDISSLLWLLVFPATYLLSNKLAGEHSLLTELLGFALLSLSAVIAKFLLTDNLDVRLFVGVALYFTAGVFKVKALLLGKTRNRVLTALHVVFAAYAYRRFHISLIILLPLIDNLIVAATLYRVKLQTTGWIEVAKSLAFLGLMIAYY